MAGVHLQDLILDVKATASNEQKIDCLKLLSVVVKNLGNPAKVSDPKYRQLRLSNEKVQQKLLPCPSAMDYMKAIGFNEVTDSDGAVFLRIPGEVSIDLAQMQSSLVELNNAIEMLGGTVSAKKIVQPSTKTFVEEKKTPEGIIIRSSKLVSTSYPSTGKMSEKQKARELMEKKRKKEAEEAKAQRAKNVALLKQDKYVRENDANWKSGQSAACVKSGTGISTFRDKYGEN